MMYLDRGAVLCTATREAYTGIMTGNVVDTSYLRPFLKYDAVALG